MGIFGTVVGAVSTAAPVVGSLLRERLNSVAPFWAALAFGLLTALTMTRASSGRAPTQAILKVERIDDD